jgi:membrane protein implicated in regulation of membrane protease activity
MKIQDVILLALAAGLIIVGIHLTVTQGLMVSYPVFMFAVVFLFWFKYRRNKEEEQNPINHEEKFKGKRRR